MKRLVRCQQCQQLYGKRRSDICYAQARGISVTHLCLCFAAETKNIYEKKDPLASLGKRRRSSSSPLRPLLLLQLLLTLVFDGGDWSAERVRQAGWCVRPARPIRINRRRVSTKTDRLRWLTRVIRFASPPASDDRTIVTEASSRCEDWACKTQGMIQIWRISIAVRQIMSKNEAVSFFLSFSSYIDPVPV